MLNFLNGLWNTVTSAPGVIWGGLKGAALALWHFMTGVFDNVGSAWDWMVNGVEWLTTNLGGWAAWVFNALRHIFEVTIPNAIATAVSDAAHWAAGAIAAAARAVLRVANEAFSFARQLASAVVAPLAAAFHTAAHTLSIVWSFVTGVGARAVDLVLHPERLLVWIIEGVGVPALVGMIRLLAPVFAAVIRDGEPLAAEIAGALEDVLVKLL